MPIPQEVRAELGLDISADFLNSLPAEVSEPEPADQSDVEEVAEMMADRQQGFLTVDEHWLGGQAIELERVVSASGNVKVGPQQFWIGPVHAGRRLGCGWRTFPRRPERRRLSYDHIEYAGRNASSATSTSSSSEKPCPPDTTSTLCPCGGGILLGAIVSWTG